MLARAESDLCRPKEQRWCGGIELGGIELGGVGGMIHEFSEMYDNRPAIQKVIDSLHTCFTNNQGRMDYPTYVARGLRISSGIVESANFHVTGARLKQQGMRWSEDGEREITMLCADLCNEVWAKRGRALLAA